MSTSVYVYPSVPQTSQFNRRPRVSGSPLAGIAMSQDSSGHVFLNEKRSDGLISPLVSYSKPSSPTAYTSSRFIRSPNSKAASSNRDGSNKEKSKNVMELETKTRTPGFKQSRRLQSNRMSQSNNLTSNNKTSLSGNPRTPSRIESRRKLSKRLESKRGRQCTSRNMKSKDNAYRVVEPREEGGELVRLTTSPRNDNDGGARKKNANPAVSPVQTPFVGYTKYISGRSNQISDMYNKREYQKKVDSKYKSEISPGPKINVVMNNLQSSNEPASCNAQKSSLANNVQFSSANNGVSKNLSKRENNMRSNMTIQSNSYPTNSFPSTANSKYTNDFKSNQSPKRTASRDSDVNSIISRTFGHPTHIDKFFAKYFK